MDARLRALNRFGLGARIGERDRLGDPRGWLEAQLSSPDASSLTVDVELPSLEEVGSRIRLARTAQRAGDVTAASEARRLLRDLAGREVAAVQQERVRTDVPFLERLVGFWSNHLCVSASKAQVAPVAGHYERTVIRPHVMGRFEDMVLASARHPAMLAYLDNAQSIGPRSRAARRAARRGRARGLNENYARELLELHTVGVEGGYDQEDVEQLARILTGWSISGIGPRDRTVSYGFAFRPEIHEPGHKRVLGRTYRESGEDEGRAVIKDLCRRPETARFVSTKLVRHFVADDPPADAVDRVTSTFLETEGDLREVSRTLVHLNEAWELDHRKLRHPQDWLTAVLRSVNAAEVGGQAGRILRQLRHAPWAPPSPKGYGDTLADWADPDSLMNRAELTRSLAQRVRRGGRAFSPGLLGVFELAPNDRLHGLASDPDLPEVERIALVLGGPAFQWR